VPVTKIFEISLYRTIDKQRQCKSFFIFHFFFFFFKSNQIKFKFNQNIVSPLITLQITNEAPTTQIPWLMALIIGALFVLLFYVKSKTNSNSKSTGSNSTTTTNSQSKQNQSKNSSSSNKKTKS